MAESQRKRCREEEEEVVVEERVKRFCGLTAEAEELIHMLEETEDRNVAEEDVLFGVMKSLEEEISSCCSGENVAEVEAEAEAEAGSSEMSYLLTASDDELGIPPSPSLIDSPPPPPPEGLWHFEEYSPSWAPPPPEYVYDEFQEKDFGGCGGLFELSEGELPRRQETTCAI